MENVTQVIESRGGLVLETEVSDPKKLFSMFNTGGVEAEIGEFLWALVRATKPNRILETGTHKGISSSYMALGMQNNGFGKITTLEVLDALRQESLALWKKLGIADHIESLLHDCRTYVPSYDIDILLLDSEPQYRFDEFVKFFPFVKPGGFIIIHDLHSALGHSGQTINEMYDWPFGDFRTKIGPFIKNFDVQTFHLGSPRGCAIFQKRANGFAHADFLEGKI